MADGKRRPQHNPLAGCVNLLLFVGLLVLVIMLFFALLRGSR